MSSNWFPTFLCCFQDEKPDGSWFQLKPSAVTYINTQTISCVIIPEKTQFEGTWIRAIICLTDYKVLPTFYNDGTFIYQPNDIENSNENVRGAWLWHTDVGALLARAKKVESLL